MSRTIRRPHTHLLRWWMPKLKVLKQSKKDWRQKRLPGLYYSQQEPIIVRRVQSDIHRFFCGIGASNRRRYERKVRQYTKLRIKHCNEMDAWDSFINPTSTYPCLW